MKSRVIVLTACIVLMAMKAKQDAARTQDQQVGTQSA